MPDWKFIVGILFVAVVSYKLALKLFGGEQAKFSFFKYIYVFLVYGILFLFGIVFSFSMLGSAYNSIIGEKHTATIVDYNTEQNDDGGTNYAPIVEFEYKGKVVRSESNLYSSGQPEPVGSSINIAYNEETGEMSLLSTSGILMTFFVLLISLILLAFAIYGAIYAFSNKISSPINFVFFVFLKIIVPIGAFSFTCLLIYAFYGMVTNPKPDQPLWALILIGFFALTMLLAIQPILKMCWGGGFTSSAETETEFLEINKTNIFVNEYDEPSCNIKHLESIISETYDNPGKAIIALLPQFVFEQDNITLQFDDLEWDFEEVNAKNREKEEESLLAYAEDLKKIDWETELKKHEDYKNIDEAETFINHWLIAKTKEDVLAGLSLEILFD